MTEPHPIDLTAPTRDLQRVLRVPPESPHQLPESLLWQVFLELRRRGDPVAATQFVAGLRTLLRRRGLASGVLPMVDVAPEEHRLSEDPYLGELWRSYKRLVCSNRTGPASQILREVEAQLQVS